MLQLILQTQVECKCGKLTQGQFKGKYLAFIRCHKIVMKECLMINLLYFDAFGSTHLLSKIK